MHLPADTAYPGHLTPGHLGRVALSGFVAVTVQAGGQPGGVTRRAARSGATVAPSSGIQT